MKKYMVLVVILTGYSLNTHAENYVFGGRAHFNGALVNPGCAVGVDHQSAKLPYFVKQNSNQVMLAFSECSAWIFKGLNLEFSDIEQKSPTKAKDANQSIEVAENVVNQQQDTHLDRFAGGRIYYHYKSAVTGDTENMVGIVQMSNHVKQFPEKLLLSVAYP